MENKDEKEQEFQRLKDMEMLLGLYIEKQEFEEEIVQDDNLRRRYDKAISELKEKLKLHAGNLFRSIVDNFEGEKVNY